MTRANAYQRAAMASGLIMLSASLSWANGPKTVFKKVGPAVVLILGSDDGKAGSAGTGSIVTADGKVVTNAHVVINPSGQPYKVLYVFMKPAKLTGDNAKDLSSRYKASVVSFSPAEELDLALLQIENPPPQLPTIAFGDPEEVEVGDSAIAIGHPEQGGLWTLTTGAVSSMIANFNRIKGKHVFQTEASVNRGNSGGPLLNDDGAMIGINTCIARRAADGVTITDVNFALKSSVAVQWLTGQGMGLAYASPREENKVMVAAPPEPKVVGEGPVAVAAAPASPSVPSGARAAVKEEAPKAIEPPPATIVVQNKELPKSVEQAQQKAEQVKAAGKAVGQGQAGEKLEKGQRLDPNTAKPPTYHTEKRPMDLEQIRAQQMKELDDMMDEMRGKVRRKSGRGMGLW